MRAGLRFLRGSRRLRVITWSSAALAAIDSAWFALLVLFIENDLGFGPTAFGIFLAVGALGGLFGAALAGRYLKVDLAGLALGVFVLMAGSLLGLAAFPNVAVTAIVLVLSSGGFALWNVFMASARQRVTPNAMLGRVGAAYRTVVVAASILGAIAGGIIAGMSSIRWTLAVGGIAALLAAPLVSIGFRPARDQDGPSVSN